MVFPTCTTIAGACRHAGQHAVSRRFQFQHHFVGFDFREWLALGDRVAFFLKPRDDFAGFLRHLERRHDDADGHLAGDHLFIRALASTIIDDALAGFGIVLARGWQRTIHSEVMGARDQKLFSRNRVITSDLFP